MWVKSPLKKETWAPINQAFFSLSFFWMYIMESSLLKSRSLHSVIQVVPNELLCLKYLFAQIDPGHCTSQWGLPNSCLNLEYHQWCNIFHSCCAHSVTAMYIHTSDDSLSLCVCVCVCSLGHPCCGTGTAWQLLTRGTWPSSPTMRSKLGFKSSFTSLAGEISWYQTSTPDFVKYSSTLNV